MRSVSDYQLALLTRDRPEPVPVPPGILRRLAMAISAVWTEIAAEAAPVIAALSEPEITPLVAQKLNNLRDTDQQWRAIVSCVVVAPEMANVTADALKKPDLTFQLTSGHANHPFASECKLLDHKKRKTLTLYRDEGMKRFIDGQYGWSHMEGFMIAFVRDGSTPIASLPTIIPAGVIAWDCPDGLERCSSMHGRSFNYGNGNPMPDITLFHLWLETP
jgi:hypothetical protein